ncbi:hypothetical protein GCM10029964_035160 [Kibdelosporangium lantanae]
MHLMRLGEAGGEQPVARADDGQLYDLSGLTRDIDGAFLAADGIARVTEALAAGTLPRSTVPACGSDRRSRSQPRSCASGSTTGNTHLSRVRPSRPSR